MLHLATTTPPTDAASLQRAIQGGLDRYLDGVGAGGVVVEEAEPEGWPRLAVLKADVSGARVRVSALPSKPPRVDPASIEAGPTARRLEVVGQTLDLEGCPVGLRVEGHDVELGFGHEVGGGKGGLLLVLRSARDGSVIAMVAKAAMDELLRRKAREPMAKQGVKLQDLDWSITQDGPRGVAVQAKVVASKKVVFASVNGTFHFTARLDVDEEMVATLSGLTCRGEGVVGGAAAPYLEKKLAEQNGRKVPLASLLPSGLELQDVALTTDATSLSVTAKFGA